jgi:hypothetical protein
MKITTIQEFVLAKRGAKTYGDMDEVLESCTTSVLKTAKEVFERAYEYDCLNMKEEAILDSLKHIVKKRTRIELLNEMWDELSDTINTFASKGVDDDIIASLEDELYEKYHEWGLAQLEDLEEE